MAEGRPTGARLERAIELGRAARDADVLAGIAGVLRRAGEADRARALVAEAALGLTTVTDDPSVAVHQAGAVAAAAVDLGERAVARDLAAWARHTDGAARAAFLLAGALDLSGAHDAAEDALVDGIGLLGAVRDQLSSTSQILLGHTVGAVLERWGTGAGRLTGGGRGSSGPAVSRARPDFSRSDRG
jgi:hypothetical protein